MPIRPPNPTLELLRVYREQLSLKDAQIESLTSLLKEANARLAEQQKISESVLELQVKRLSGTSQMLIRQPPEEEAVVAAQRVGENASETNAGPILLHQEAVTSAPAHAPISMAYFTPLEGLTPGRKGEDNNGRNSPEKIEAEERDEPAKAQEWPLAHDSDFRRDASAWRIPVLAPIGLASVLILGGVVWWNSRSARRPDPRLVAALARIKTTKDSTQAESPRQSTSSLPHAPSSPAAPPASASSPPKSAVITMTSKPGVRSTPAPTMPVSPLVRVSSPVGAPPSKSTAAPASQSLSTLPAIASRETLDQIPVSGHDTESLSDEALIQAVTDQDLHRIEDLLDRGANVNASNAHRSTMLAIASRYGYLKIVDRLLDRGAEINAANDRGWTALMLAVNYNHPSTVRALLSYKPLPDLRNSQGSTALMLAAKQGNREIVKGLLDIGADATLKNNQGQTARDLADVNGHGDIAKMLGRY